MLSPWLIQQSFDLSELYEYIRTMKRTLTTLVFTIFTFTLISQLSAQSGEPSGQTSNDPSERLINTYKDKFDINYYKLFINIDVTNKSIQEGRVDAYFTIKQNTDSIYLNLFSNMKVDSVTMGAKRLTFHIDNNVIWILLPNDLSKDKQHQISVSYHGAPTIAIRPPWNGGWSWSNDQNGNLWMNTAVQGIGASSWWPCKDHPSDEPDSTLIQIVHPKSLSAISNGKFMNSIPYGDNTLITTWKISYPINTYNISINLGNYVHFQEQYQGKNGALPLDYYVLPYNKANAKRQFKQVPKMLEAFEHYFGPYPFYNDGFKMVETNFLGMEHQSCVAYGNGYQNGYLGFSHSKPGTLFDFIIIHESGHEWWGNNVSTASPSNLWIHEAFTTYSEALYVEYFYGKDAYNEYVHGWKQLVQNDKPIIGEHGIESSTDMYYKGALMLHTLRNAINNDSSFISMFKTLQNEFKYQTISYDQFISFMNKHFGQNLSNFFNAYLATKEPPTLSMEVYYKLDKTVIYYNWEVETENLSMPINVSFDGATKKLEPTTTSQKLEFPKNKPKEIVIDQEGYYVKSKIKYNYEAK